MAMSSLSAIAAFADDEIVLGPNLGKISLGDRITNQTLMMRAMKLT